MRLFTLLALSALVLSCTGDDQIAQVGRDGVPHAADFAADAEPRAVVPSGLDMAEIALPLAQRGGDSLQNGMVYAAVLGGYYLMRVQLEGGNFNYQYNLEAHAWSEDDSIHRQCGSTITQAFLLRVTGRPEFKVSARRGLDYLHAKAKLQDDGSLNLAGMGATALLTIATSLYTLHSGDDTYADALRLLGQNLLTYVDAETGEFAQADRYFLGPGQVMMALEHVHAATGDDVYLDALEAAGRWAVDNPDAHGWDPYFGLWANEPLTYLYARRPDEAFAQAAYAMADPIVAAQHVPGESDDASWDGGYALDADTTKPSWATSLRLEAVIDAYRMALLDGDEVRQASYRQSALWAAGYLMRLQFRAGETDGHVDPTLLVGAVPFSVGGKYVRVDVTHHVANVLVKTAEYLALEHFPGVRAPDDVTP